MKTIKFVIICILLASISLPVLAETEAVVIVSLKELNTKAIIQRKNGDRHLLSYGAGAHSIWRYEGKVVLIDSPFIFLGVGSYIILPNEDQKARIWDSKLGV